MEYTTMTVGGVKGPTWTCDDDAEAAALAEEHGYEVLDVTEAEAGGYYLVVAG